MEEAIFEHEIGSDDGLKFAFHWFADQQGAADLAWGSAMVWIAGIPVWYAQGSEDSDQHSVRWTWLDLLEFLGRAWLRLSFEQSYPFGLTPETPLKLRDAAEKWWDDQDLNHQLRLESDEELFRFESHHDLASGMRGLALPPLVLMREGLAMWLCSPDIQIQCPAAQALKTLEDVGDLICSRIGNSEQPKAVAALERWKNRFSFDRRRFVEIATGLQGELLRALEGGKPENDFWELPVDRIEDTELLAAARMSEGNLSLDEQKSLLEKIRDIPYRLTPFLDSLAKETIGLLAKEDLSPHEQGYALARWLRSKLAFEPMARIEPAELLRRWHVKLEDIELEAAGLEAISCWGPRHGPAVIVNRRGSVAGTPHGKRSTLAHEICHLIVDRSWALPLAEVLISKSPLKQEKRSRAFAAELLLPRASAADAVRKAVGIEATVAELMTSFGVGKQIVGWQITNGELYSSLGPLEKAYVDKLTRTPA